MVKWIAFGNVEEDGAVYFLGAERIVAVSCERADVEDHESDNAGMIEFTVSNIDDLDRQSYDVFEVFVPGGTRGARDFTARVLTSTNDVVYITELADALWNMEPDGDGETP